MIITFTHFRALNYAHMHQILDKRGFWLTETLLYGLSSIDYNSQQCKYSHINFEYNAIKCTFIITTHNDQCPVRSASKYYYYQLVKSFNQSVVYCTKCIIYYYFKFHRVFYMDNSWKRKTLEIKLHQNKIHSRLVSDVKFTINRLLLDKW